MRRYFGTDGVRGIVGESLTFELFLAQMLPLFVISESQELGV